MDFLIGLLLISASVLLFITWKLLLYFTTAKRAVFLQTLGNALVLSLFEYAISMGILMSNKFVNRFSFALILFSLAIFIPFFLFLILSSFKEPKELSNKFYEYVFACNVLLSVFIGLIYVYILPSSWDIIKILNIKII